MSMDLETENRLAAMLMEEATRLRLQAEKEGVNVYLQKPNVRGRPNSRFLTATVLGVQQANRTVEVNEMWRLRKKELDLDDRLMGRSRDKSRCRSNRHDGDCSERSLISKHGEADENVPALCTSSKRGNEDSSSSEEGSLKDEEVEEFLHSRVKRGRGAIGSRMDEPGPYLPSSCTDSKGKPLANSDERVMEQWERGVVGPERPPFLKSREVAKDEFAYDRQKVKKVDSVSLTTKRRHSKRGDRSEEKLRKKKRKEKRSKHGGKHF